MRKRCLILLVCLLLPWGASAQTRLYTFAEDAAPETLRQVDYAVNDQEVVISLTFGGDCTLGGETAYASSSRSYASRVAQNGMDWPFQQLQTLFAADDATIVNLEGVLSASREGKVKKKFNFLGDPSLAGVLTAGSVEVVTLANNHTLDYGQRGYEDTKAALLDAAVAYVDETTLMIVEKDGQRVGFTASVFSTGSGIRERLTRQVALLRDLGCGAVVHLMHAGTEYKARYSARQKGIAQAAIQAGADLVVGSHPHVVQGAEVYDGVPVVYSLGNLSFGGNGNPRDYDMLLLSVRIHLSGGEKKKLEWTLWPGRVSSEKGRNNFQPVLLDGEEARRVMEKVQKRSDTPLEPYQEGLGAVQK